jgi:hypothetical protein
MKQYLVKEVPRRVLKKKEEKEEEKEENEDDDEDNGENGDETKTEEEGSDDEKAPETKEDTKTEEPEEKEPYTKDEKDSESASKEEETAEKSEKAKDEEDPDITIDDDEDEDDEDIDIITVPPPKFVSEYETIYELKNDTKTHKYDINVTSHLYGRPTMTPAMKEAAITRLSNLDKNDEDVYALRKTKNDFEELIYSAREWMSDEDNQKYVVTTEVEPFLHNLTEHEDWLYEDGYTESKEVFEGKI